MLQSQIPTRFQIPFANSASAPYTRPVPVPSQILIQAGAASLTDGFPPVTFLPIGAGGTPMWGADMNGILNQITAWDRWQAAGGPITYDSTFATAVTGYPLGAVINSATIPGYAWLCTVDANTVNPDTGTPQSPASGWVPIALQGGTLTTGAMQFRPTSEALPGWVIANGTTIGDGSSAATQLADASAVNLFAWHWTNFSNSQCPVSGGRGASAAADFAAHKTIQVLGWQGTTPVGVDTMGGGTTTKLTGVPVTSGGLTVPGSVFGENLHSLTSGENGPHTHTFSHFTGNQAGTPGANSLMGFADTGTTNSSGSGTAHNTVSLAMGCYFYLKL